MGDKIPDKVLDEISDLAHLHGIDKIILFGSRARGTNTERSDIDIAVSGGDFDAFYRDVKEKADTLLTFDMVEMDKGISEGLKEEIDRDGVIIKKQVHKA